MRRGKGRVPVADYSLTAQALPDYAEVSSQTAMNASHTHTATSGTAHPEAEQATVLQHPQAEQTGRSAGISKAQLPVSSLSRLGSLSSLLRYTSCFSYHVSLIAPCIHIPTHPPCDCSPGEQSFERALPNLLPPCRLPPNTYTFLPTAAFCIALSHFPSSCFYLKAQAESGNGAHDKRPLLSSMVFSSSLHTLASPVLVA